MWLGRSLRPIEKKGRGFRREQQVGGQPGSAGAPVSLPLTGDTRMRYCKAAPASDPHYDNKHQEDSSAAGEGRGSSR